MWKSLQQASIKQLSIILGIIVFAIYFPSFFNTFIWDDEQFIVKNVFTTSFQYIPQIFTTNTIAGAGEVSNYYRPLTTLSFTFDRMLWGLRPFGFHLTNTLLHIDVSVLLFVILKRLIGSKAQSWLAALLYVVHPLHTEAVTYINSRGDSLFSLFLLLSLFWFDKAIGKESLTVSWQGKDYRVGSLWLGIICILTFSLSILSKEIAVAGLGLFAILGLYRFLQRKIKSGKPILVLLVSLGLLVVGYLGLRLTVLNFNNSLNFYDFETEYSQSLPIRVLTFSRVLLLYCQLILLPYPLHMERDIELVRSLWSVWPWLTLALASSWVGVSWIEITKRRTGLIALGGLWFIGMLLPVSGIVPINGILYEHWLYVPLMGALLAGIGVWRMIRQLSWQRYGQWLVIGSALVFASLTIRQNWLWRHPIPFYTYTLRYAESARLNNNLGMAYAEAGDQEMAIGFYRKALRQSNVYPQIYYNLARSYRELGELAPAIENAKLALQISPDFIYPYSFLAEIYLQQQQYELALPMLAYLFTAVPNDIQIGLIYGQTLFITGETDKAEQVWNETYQRSGLDFRVMQAITRFKQAEANQAKQQK